MVLTIHEIGAAACRGRTITLAPSQCSNLVDGRDEVDREAERTAALEYELAGKPPATLH